MPQLVAFNRRWAIGSDDFVYPGLGEIILRFIWLIAISVVFHIHKDTFDCEGGNLLRAYYIGLLFLLVINIIMTAIVVYTSTTGTITNISPRRKIAKLIYIKLALSVPELAWNIIGTYWAFGSSSGCEHHVVMTVKGVVIFGWLIGLVVVIGIAIVFDPLGALHQHGSSSSHQSDNDMDQAMVNAASTAKKVWEARCHILCCCVGCDEQSSNAFQSVAELFSNFFQGVDLVPTDIACGLILVHREQQVRKHALTTVTVEPSSRPIDQPHTDRCQTLPSSASCQVDGLPNPRPWMTLELMHHYMKFAMASYGWPLYIFTHLMTGSCQLWSQCNYACIPSCLCCRGQHKSCWSVCIDWLRICKSQSMTIIETEKELNELCLSLECCACIVSQSDIKDDNCCRCNTSAIRKTTGVHSDDIVYASFHNKIYETPFFVSIDRQTRSVVVAVRGTLSLKDVITDLTAECETLQIDGLENCVAHKGILQSAKYVKNTLEQLHILDQAFDRAQGARLVITGHSLGAGTAALLAILLKPKYPDLICFAFSPPGELMSMCASQYSQEFTCSVVLGKDIIPRLGIHTMEDLKAKLLQAIHGSDLPKYKLLASGMWQLLCGLNQTTLEEMNQSAVRRPLLDNQTSVTYSAEQRNLETAIHNALRQSEQSRLSLPRMYPPGQILHIREASKTKVCCGVPDYYTEWSQPENFGEVLVSPKMLSDHFPDAVMRALEKLKEEGLSLTSTRSHAGAIVDV